MIVVVEVEIICQISRAKFNSDVKGSIDVQLAQRSNSLLCWPSHSLRQVNTIGKITK